MFSSIYLLYRKQELENLPSIYIIACNKDNFTVSSTEKYAMKEITGMVSQTDRFSKEEAYQRTYALFNQFGIEIDDTRIDIYDECAHYWDRKDRFNIFMYFNGGTYSLTDFDKI